MFFGTYTAASTAPLTGAAVCVSLPLEFIRYVLLDIVPAAILWGVYSGRSSWERQIRRLLVLCAASLAPPRAPDPLVQQAAVRLLAVLTDAALWKCFEPGYSPF